MGNTANDINRITTAIIRLSVKLILCALVLLALYEGAVRGFAFGHEIFYAEAAEAPPGRDMTVVIEEGTTVSQAAGELAEKGLIKNEFAFLFQSRFYEYNTVYPGTYELNTSMTSKEILQALNVKPQEEETQEEPAGARLKTSGDDKAQPAAAPASEEAPDAEEEMEGGWIEDAGEDAA